MKLITRSLLLGLLLFSHALAQRVERNSDAWSPSHFDIRLRFDAALSRVESAVTTIDIRAKKEGLTMFDLDFGTMPVSAVKVDGRAAKFIAHDEKLDVYLDGPTRRDQTLRVSVTYSGVPKDGLILSKDRDGSPSAIGDNWADRVHHWIPCLDHPSAKASVAFTVTAGSEYEAVANGVQVSKTPNPDTTVTWTFNEARPVSPYNMVVAVGKFAHGTVTGASSIPITYYVPQSDALFAARAFAPAVPSVATFSNLVAPYPYKKLALIVGATRFGGMENANTIVFPPTYFRNFEEPKGRSKKFDIPSRIEETNAHEIAHQWFGDSVTEATWADLWLSEGFATYFAGLFLEQAEGENAFGDYMREKASSYLQYEKTRRTPIHDTETKGLFDLLNPNNYEKGGWVLHMLRRSLGDKAFFAGIRDYYQTHQDSVATTEDLRASLEKSSGRDLKTFFERWVYQAGHPIYQAKWQSAGGGQIVVTLNQMQPDQAFLEPVTVEIKTKGGARRIVISPKDKAETLKIKSATPLSITVDPDNSILKEVVN